MPAMPRPKGKVTQIAYRVLGITKTPKAKSKELDKQLLVQETVRER